MTKIPDTQLQQYHHQARQDIELSIDIWKELLEDNINYAYLKGSAIKKWDSAIDYVPVISDLDIHVFSKGEVNFNKLSIQDALNYAIRYEQAFQTRSSEPLHVPRPQIIDLNGKANTDTWIFPRKDQLRIVVGEVPDFPLVNPYEVKRIDMENILAFVEYVNTLPSRVFDRTGIDFWTIVRELTWRVSATPYRLVSQYSTDPYEIWDLNRTQLCQQLVSLGFEGIAGSYTAFYLRGWSLFLSGFQSSNDFHAVIEAGYNTLTSCIKSLSKEHGA